MGENEHWDLCQHVAFIRLLLGVVVFAVSSELVKFKNGVSTRARGGGDPSSRPAQRARESERDTGKKRDRER